MFSRHSITSPFRLLMLVSVSISPWGSAHAGDAKAGEAIATQQCAACHGADGNSIAPNFPNLAGQVEGYIVDQLKRMKSGERPVAEMTAFVADLTPEDMSNLGAYYAEQQAQKAAIPESDVESAERGEHLFRGGLREMQVAACMSCHAPDGRGIPQRYPRVANQHRDYLTKQLLAYKSGERKSEGNIMNDIAFKLSVQQIEDVSAYMHALK